MSFLPARMTRLLVGGHMQHQAGVIEVLHAEKAVHLEDYHDPTQTTRIGEPLAHGAQVSELLVRLRGLQKALGASSPADRALVTGEPAHVLAEADRAAAPVLQRASELRAGLLAAQAEEAALAPFAGLNVDLALLRGLRSVRTFLGICRSDPRPRLAQLAGEASVAESPRGFAVALFVPVAQSAAAEAALASCGFQAAEAPAVAGTPAARLAALGSERARLTEAAAAVERETEALRTAWGPRLAALESQLAAEAEKTQAPLKFGQTEATFHLEGWLPRGRVNRVRNALAARFGESVYVEDIGDAPRNLDAAPHAGRAGGHDDAHAGGHPASEPKDEPPIHLENPRPAKPYEFLLGLLGKPRYREIDPTKLMLVFFPLFFGLMVGDVLVGAVIVVVGNLLKKHRLFGIGGPAVGRALVAGGVLSILVGGVVFGEAMGIHFVTPDPHDGGEKEISWEEVLGLHIPGHGFLHKTGQHAEPAAGPAMAALQEGAEEHKGLLAPHSDVHLSVNGWFNLGYYSKVHDIQALLVWSILIAFVHLVLGLALGVRNVWIAHGPLLAMQEKGAWLVLMAAAGLLVWGLTAAGTAVAAVGGGLFLASVVLLWQGAAHTYGQGFIALLEIPGLLANFLSYTRLAAIGASKAGMVIALNAIGFTIVGGGPLGWAIYVVGFAAIIPLAILAGGLQSLRLQFVEFFQKFYTGGGRAYLPFGRRAA